MSKPIEMTPDYIYSFSCDCARPMRCDWGVTMSEQLRQLEEIRWQARMASKGGVACGLRCKECATAPEAASTASHGSIGMYFRH